MFNLLDTISDCIHLSITYPALYVASLQFLSVLLNEEGRKQLEDKQNVCQNPTISFLLDHTEGCQAPVTQLTSLIIQVFKIQQCHCRVYFCNFDSVTSFIFNPSLIYKLVVVRKIICKICLFFSPHNLVLLSICSFSFFNLCAVCHCNNHSDLCV